MSDAKTNEPTIFVRYGLLLGIMIVGSVLRLHRLTGNLYSDEVWIAATAVSPSSEFFREIVQDWVHPPLFHLLTRGWAYLFGFGDATGRLLAVAFGIASIPLMYRFGTLISESKTGLVAASLLALSPTHIYHSQYGRHYSLFVFSVLLSMMFFAIHFSRPNDRKEGIFYVLSTILMVYTHYFGWFIFLCQFLFFLFFRFSHRRRWAALQSAVLLSYIPWILAVMNAAPGTIHSIPSPFRQSVEPFIPHIAWIHIPSWLEPVRTIAAFNGDIPGPHMAKLGLLLLGGISCLSMLAVRDENRFNRHLVLFVLSCVVVPFGLVFAVSCTIQPIWILRAMLLSLAPYYLLISIGSQQGRGKVLSRGLVAIPLLWMSMASWSYARSEHRMPYERIAHFLEKEAKRGIPIVVENTYLMNPIFHYYRGEAVLYELNENNVSIVPASHKRELSRILEEHRNDGDALMLVTYTSAEKQIRKALPSAFRIANKEEFYGIGEEGQIRKVQVFSFEKK